MSAGLSGSSAGASSPAAAGRYRYRYRAVDGNGGPRSGLTGADNRSEALAALHAAGLWVLSLRLDPLATASAYPIMAGRPRAGDLALFSDQMATLLGAGVPILTGLSLLETQNAGKPIAPPLARAIAQVREGAGLAASLSAQGTTFPPVFTQILAAGEAGGTLEESLRNLSGFYEREEHLGQKLKSASVYPLIVIIVSIGITLFLVTFVLPTYVGLFAQMGAKLPWTTRAVLAFSQIITGYWYLFLFGLPLLAVAGLRLARREGPARWLDRIALRLPVFGSIILKHSLSRFARTLSALHKGGVPIAVSLVLAGKTVGNRTVATAVDAIRENILQGGSMAGPMEQSGLFPPMVVQMVTVGEETGDLEGMLTKVTEIYERELERTVERLTSLLEPVLILFLGLIVGFILVSIVMPMFQIYQIVH